MARSASTWSWDSVRAASDPIVRCMRGHKVDRNMICGTVPATDKSEDGNKVGNVHKKLVKDLLPSGSIMIYSGGHERIRHAETGTTSQLRRGDGSR